ncbi:putative isopropanol dehydrogenase [Stipitochalara longipes BDJ]|nr:putative isopropanol dehydrogenase [Stipitochalara longipes BDJ]
MSAPLMKALVLHGPRDLRLDHVPKPDATPGSVIIQVQAAPLWDYLPEVIDGTRQHRLAFPLIFGTCCVGRIEEVGPDVTSLQPGALVFCDYIIRLRDAPEQRIVLGYYGGQTKQEQKLSSDFWRDGCFAEYARFPAENVHPLDEMSLERNGITASQLCELASIIPTIGAVNSISIVAGETVLVLPATGFFSSTAIVAALALGARVVAGSRSKEKLEALVKHFGEDGKRITPVVLTGDVYADTAALRAATPGGRGADAYIDYSPAAAAKTTHIEAGLLALKRYGRCCFAGIILDKVPIPYAVIMSQCLTIKGQWAQDRSDVIRAINLIEMGNLKLRKSIAQAFSLEDHETALKSAVAQSSGWEKMSIFSIS